MADYDNSTGGGAGQYWHSTAASSSHEWTHWNTDYLGDAIRVGNGTQTNTDIDAMTVAKSAQADAAAARTALEPRVTARFNTFVRAVTNRWNAIIHGTDRPGLGGRGYAAGMGMLNGLIDQVRAFAASKNWRSRGERALKGAAVGAGGELFFTVDLDANQAVLTGRGE